MQDPMAQLEEMTRATEQLISSLSAEGSDRLAAVRERFLKVLEGQLRRGPLDFSALRDPELQGKAREALRHLNDLTFVALALAAHQKESIVAALGRSRELRRFLEAVQASLPAPEGALDHSA